MKIAFVIEHFNPRYGGQQVYMRDFAEFLIERGHEVSFFTHDTNVIDDRMSVEIIKLSPLAKAMRWVQWWSFLSQVKKRVKLGSYDVVMGTGVSAAVNVYQPHGGVTKASHKQNRLLTGPIHQILKGLSNSISPKHIMAAKIERDIFTDKNVKFIAISEMVKSHMKEFYHIDDSQIELVYNGVDVERFQPSSDLEKKAAKKQLSLDEDKIIFSLVAHNFKLKGLREIISVVEHLHKKKDNFLVVVAGKGKKKAYEALIKSKGLESYFLFLGAVDNPELVYQASDVYLQPTWYDPCSLVVLEAMAAGVPVISTSFNGASEMIDSGENGYVITRPDSLDEFEFAMERLFDTDHRKVLGEKARQRVEPLTHEKNFSHMEKVFRSFS
ncbi:glycosyltransferase family 4 protein [Lentisphaera marina]|uniref:glycosyltransferase family 4 protein n=1 Tax=Lentisphaera marina TaxID=1111041 RepID=UPI0023652225|nr:glycosyltransferase family 4 protein [Lentisphaera marina]MDD7983422.1 glycosyltransferase family 4 protein [Lentisphaera marina]